MALSEVRPFLCKPCLHPAKTIPESTYRNNYRSSLKIKIIFSENPAGIIIEMDSGMVQRIYQKRLSPRNRIQSAIGYIAFWVGIVLTIGGLLILLINLIHH